MIFPIKISLNYRIFNTGIMNLNNARNVRIDQDVSKMIHVFIYFLIAQAVFLVSSIADKQHLCKTQSKNSRFWSACDIITKYYFSDRNKLQY